MNEEALQQLYSLARGEGYSKSFEDFKVLMGSNQDAINNMYSVAQNEGYQKDINEFKTLVGFGGGETVEVDVQEEVPVKKKEDTVLPSEDGSSGFAEIFKGPREFLKNIIDKEVQEAPKGIPQKFLPSDGESQMPPSVTEVIERKADIGDKTIEFETYNPAVASKSATADFTQYKDYLPAGVKEIPNAKQVLEGDYNAVVPFDQAAYEKNKEAYQIIYNNKVKDYEEYLKGKGEYIKGYDGKYYSSAKFSPETILRKELATLQSRNGNLMDLGEEAIVYRMSERLGKFGFDVKYDPSVIDIPSGRIGSAITITSQHTGKNIDINTDKINFIDLMRGDADREDAQEIDKLNAFVLKNFDEDKVEVKDLLKGLSAQDKAAMGAETERKYETLSVGRTISDAEDMVSGIDKQIEAANKMLKEAQAMPDYEKAVSTSVGSGMMMGTSLRGINKKKASKLKQAKAQLEYLKQQKKDADALLKSAEEGKQAQATKFASKVLGEQMMTESERLENEAKELSYTGKVFTDVKDRLISNTERIERLTKESYDEENKSWKSEEALQEYKDLIVEIEPDLKNQNELARIANEQLNNYNLDAENLRKDVGRKVILDAQVGGVTGSVVRAIASGTGGLAEGFYEGLVGDLYPNVINMFYNEGDEGYITDAERKEFKKDSIQDDFVGYVSDKFGITDEAMEAYRKGLSLQDMIKNVKEGKEALEGSNWLTEGIYGTIESLPAIATSLIGGAPLMFSSFAAMGINGLNKEMESNPMFANISENEKLLLTLPYGVMLGVLETTGVRNVLNNSSFVSKLFLKSIKRFKSSTNRTFRESVIDEVQNKIAKGLILTASSGAAEFETGATQKLAEGYMKEAYDVAKGMDYFKQSIDFLEGKYITKEFVDEVYKAGLSELAGGISLGAIPAISQARKNNTIAEIPIAAFMAYEMAMLDPAIRRAQTMKITEQVELGLKTKEEAAKEVQDYDITIGQLRAIPKEFDLKSRQQILALESQKKILEDKIEGKSVFTTREEQRQIKVLEERIEEVSANAQKGEAKKSNQDILTEEFVKSATKEEVAPKVAVEEEVTTEEAPVAEEVDEEVTQEQLDEVRALEEDAPVAATVVEEEVTTEETPVTEEEQEAKDKARAEKLAELDRNLREVTTDKAPVAETQEVAEDGKVPEVTQEQQDRYNNNEMSEQEIKDVLVGLNTKVQMRAEGKTEEKITDFERKIKKENETLFREVLGMRAAPKTETKVDTKVDTKVETPKKETPKKETPKKETGVDAKLRAIAVKKVAANKDRKTYKTTKAEQKLINDNKKQYAKIFTEEKMPTTTSDGIRSAIKMVEDSFKDKETKIKEQIKTIDARVSDRMTKDKDRKKKKDELSKARKEKNAKVKELKGKLTDMGAKFRLSDDVATESPEGFITEDAIVEVMKGLGFAEANFKIRTGAKEKNVNPIAQSKSTKKITDAQAKKLGFKSVADMLKNIQEFNGIPMIVAMSDVLASGVVKDSMGNDMQVDGGLLYNVLGSNIELAWAGVNKDGANTQFIEAKETYRANKELFDRLWKEGKLPNNHIPMVVVRMDNAAINSNEAMFRFMAPKLKSFPKEVQKIAFDTFLEQLESKKKSKSEEPLLIEAFIEKNNIKDLGTLFDLIVEDAKKRAKGDAETFSLTTKSYLLDMIASPVGVKKASKPVAKAIMNATDYNGEIFLIDNILSEIGEPSMVEGERGDAVAIMGVDISKDGGVKKANHNNYGFGPKGRLIALIKNPTNVLEIFPEWRTKAFKMFEVKPSTGKMKTDAQVLADVYGQVFGDKAFRGSRVTEEMSDIDMVSAQMRFAFPSVSVSQTQQEFDEALKQEGIRTAESNGNTILGLTKDGKIFLNPSRKSLSTPIHEFGHIWIDFLRSESSKTKGTKLLKKGLELVEGTKALESAIKKYGDNELAREEALVELMGTKGETIANAAKRAKFIEWFNAFFKYIKEKLTRFKDVKVKDIKDISLEDFVDIGLAELFSGEAVDTKFKPDEAATSAKARMQIIGENADLSQQVRENLSIARAMEENNKSPKDIRLATGWEKGTDGKWRYETLPNELNKESKALKEIDDSVFEIVKVAVKNPEKLIEAKKEYKLSDLIKNKELFNAYRKMSQEEAKKKFGRWDYTMNESIEDLKVVIDISTYHYEGGIEGMFMKPAFFEDGDPSITIYVNPLYYYDKPFREREFELLQIISHEVQHYAQMLKEDFSRGTSPEGVLDEISSSLANVYQRQNEIKTGVISSISFNGEFDIEVRKKIRPKIEDIFDSEMSSKEMSKKINNLISKSKGDEKLLLETVKSRLDKIISIEQRIEQYEEVGSSSQDFENYKKAAGEVEARNVEERLSMTPEQRRETLFEETEDVAREDQLLFMSEFDAESFYSMASMKEKGVDLKGTIEKVIARARAKEISDNVIIAYLMQDKGFDRKKALATIKRVNRKNLRSAIKSLFASVEDITNISEQEAELVKELLKYDRATTRADKAIQKKAKQELLAQVSVMARASKGKISAAQLSAVISRLTRVNLSRQSSIDGFVDYMRKVFSNADYAQKIVGLKSKITQAKKNITTKIGIGKDGLSYELTALFSIDPSIIPDDVFTKYEKLVTSFGARQTELSLPEASELKQDIADINDSLNTQNSLVGELTERFNSFEDKKTTEDGKVEYAATVKRMLKDKVITEEEAKLMTKFSKEINPREEKEGKSEEQKEKEMDEQKKELIQEVKDSEINAQAIDDKMSKQVAEDLSEMIKTEAINELSNPQLKNLIKVIDNINNGHLTHNAKLMIEALESSDDSDIGTDGVKNADPLKVGKELAKLKTLTRKGKDKNTFYKLLERNPLYYLDTVLGDATSKKIFNSVMEKPAEAFSKYNTELNKAYDEIDKAERLIIKHFKSNGNDVTFSKFKQMAYMVQEEFESNPNSNQVNPASEVLDATIEKLEETNQERNAEALLKIKEDFSTNGQIDLDKLMKSFSTAEKKMLKAIKQFNSSQTDMAVFTAAVIRGQAIDPLNNYVHQQVLSEGTDNIAAGSAFEDLSKMTDMFALNTKPSTKAKNLIDRTKGAKAINFDVVSATKRAAKMTLMDYHLTSSLRTANKTLNKMSDKLDKKGQQRQIFKGIRDGYNQAIRDALQVNFAADYSLIGKGFQVLTKNAYRGILAHSGRVGVEFLSNLSFAINNPLDFSQGVRHLDVALGSMGAEVMNNVDSKQTTRVYPSGLSGNYVDPNLITDNKGVVSNEMKNPVVNKLNQAMALGPSRLTKGVGAIADTMLSGPDKVMMRPIWFGSFAREFTAQVKNRKDLIMQTAKMRKEGATDKQIKEYIDKETEVDFKKIAENDAEYMSRYKKEIREAKRKADDNSVLMGSTNNPLMGILKNTKRNSDTFAAAAYKNFNTFMQNFLLFEFNAFRRGWYTAMQGKTKEQKASGLLLMGAVSLRMMMYNVLMSYGFSLLFGGDDDKEEDSLATRVSRSFWNTFTGLILGRDFGAAVKSLIGVGVESVNKIHGEDLGIREGEYNPYKNSVQFNPSQMLIGKEKDEDTGEESWTIMSSKPKEVLAYSPVNVLSDIAPNFLGPLSPLAKTLAFGFNKVLLEKPKTTEAGKRKDELEEYRLLLEIGGHSGFVPFYKDFRNELLDEMYKDVGKKKKSSGKSSRPKRPSRGKRKSRPKR